MAIGSVVRMKKPLRIYSPEGPHRRTRLRCSPQVYHFARKKKNPSGLAHSRGVNEWSRQRLESNHIGESSPGKASSIPSHFPP